jgi:hypothetical protein
MTIKQAVVKRNNLRAEGWKLYNNGNKIYAKGSTHCAEGSKLQIESRKLYAEADLVVIDAVIEEHGPEATVEFNGGRISVSCNTTEY